jgi:hypothetical protein
MIALRANISIQILVYVNIRFFLPLDIISQAKILPASSGRTDYSSAEVLIIRQPRTLARVILFMEWQIIEHFRTWTIIDASFV